MLWFSSRPCCCHTACQGHHKNLVCWCGSCCVGLNAPSELARHQVHATRRSACATFPAQYPRDLDHTTGQRSRRSNTIKWTDLVQQGMIWMRRHATDLPGTNPNRFKTQQSQTGSSSPPEHTTYMSHLARRAFNGHYPATRTRASSVRRIADSFEIRKLKCRGSHRRKI